MKKILLFAILLSGAAKASAQKETAVHTDAKGNYINHTVAAKEGLYAIGRKYDVAAKDIAAYNGFDINAPLSVGQTIKIPVKGKVAAIQKEQPAAEAREVRTKGTPVYYTVEASEGLYRVSAKNGNVALDNLRKWNNLNSDALSAGQRLIVGYSDGKADVAAEQRKEEAVVKKTPEPKKEVAKNDAYNDEDKPAVEVIKKTETVITKPAATPVIDNNTGYFKPQFDAQKRNADKEATVTSGIFKTASGWQDAKYYALIDGIDAGTIIRVINPVNNKAVYAKVLGEMSGIRQNAGMELRISNAAASALQIDDMDKFIVRVNY